MRTTGISRRYAHFDDGTGWPLPDSETSDDASLEWILRYGQPTRSQILEAAGYVAAYGALLGKTQRRQREVIRAILDASTARQG